MKFDKTRELENFIKDSRVFSNVIEFHEIYEGGSSYNFFIRTSDEKNNTFLLKLISDEKVEMYNRLVCVLSEMREFIFLPIDTFENYKMLAMPYISGHKLRYNNVTKTFIDALDYQYLKMQNCNVEGKFIRKQFIPSDMICDIQNKLDSDRSFVSKIINKYFFQNFKIYVFDKGKTTEFIHGDFTANNILVDKDNEPYLIDYDYLRFGYEIEDIAGLIIQLAGFRGMIGSLFKFKRLKMLFDAKYNYTYKEWLYGVNVFYINSLRRWVYNTTKKKKTLRKGLCYYIMLLNYFRICKFLSKVK